LSKKNKSSAIDFLQLVSQGLSTQEASLKILENRIKNRKNGSVASLHNGKGNFDGLSFERALDRGFVPPGYDEDIYTLVEQHIQGGLLIKRDSVDTEHLNSTGGARSPSANSVERPGSRSNEG